MNECPLVVVWEFGKGRTMKSFWPQALRWLAAKG